MKALIDADVIIYRAGFASQQTYYEFIPNGSDTPRFMTSLKKDMLEILALHEITSKDGRIRKCVHPFPEGQAIGATKAILNSILSDTEATEYKLYLTSEDKSNFRFEVAKTQGYKANRTSPKPLHYQAIRRYLLERWGAEEIFEMEADDALGINQQEDTIICSIDKDLDMIPGMHYNIMSKEIYETSDDDDLVLTDKNKLRGGGVKWFYAQMLLGDTVDNIPGITGYGPVKVYKSLKCIQKEDRLAEKVLDIYREMLGEDAAEDRFLEVADLLWIKRYIDQCKSQELLFEGVI